MSGNSAGNLFDLLFVKNLPVGIIESISKKIYKLLDELVIKGFEGIKISQNINLNEIGANGSLSKLLETCIYGGWEIEVELDMYLNLMPPYAQIRNQFRKSYLSLINSSALHFDFHIMDFTNFEDDRWELFVKLHFDVAGRITRNEVSWEHQAEMIKNDFAFNVLLFSKVDQSIVGAGFFEKTRDEAQYSVAAYDRSLFEFPLGHIVQDVAIKYMKNRGIKWYFLGESWEVDQNVLRTKKEHSISFFKRGFMSHLFPRILLKLNIDHGNKSK